MVAEHKADKQEYHLVRVVSELYVLTKRLLAEHHDFGSVRFQLRDALHFRRRPACEHVTFLIEARFPGRKIFWIKQQERVRQCVADAPLMVGEIVSSVAGRFDSLQDGEEKVEVIVAERDFGRCLSRGASPFPA